MKKPETDPAGIKMSFVLADSPIPNKAANAALSTVLLMILALNAAILIYAQEMLQSLPQ